MVDLPSCFGWSSVSETCSLHLGFRSDPRTLPGALRALKFFDNLTKAYVSFEVPTSSKRQLGTLFMINSCVWVSFFFGDNVVWFIFKMRISQPRNCSLNCQGTCSCLRSYFCSPGSASKIEACPPMGLARELCFFSPKEQRLSPASLISLLLQTCPSHCCPIVSWAHKCLSVPTHKFGVTQEHLSEFLHVQSILSSWQCSANAHIFTKINKQNQTEPN